MKYSIVIIAIGILAGCKSSTQTTPATTKKVTIETVETDATSDLAEANEQTSTQTVIDKIEKTDEEWKSILDPKAYYVLREEGTERPFTSDLLKEKREGVFVCGACALPLFANDTKFDSGTGWPSFYEPIDAAHIHEDTDYKIGYARTEVECNRCGGHLGHVFNDGPKPTGLRYCINGVALAFDPK